MSFQRYAQIFHFSRTRPQYLLAAMAMAMALSGVVIGAERIVISNVKDGHALEERPIIEGSVTDPKSSVWLVVHPMEVSNFWVQPAISVRVSGVWRVMIYLGNPGALDAGKRFEIRAIVNPKQKLREGQILTGWPDAQGASEVIEVTRK